MDSFKNYIALTRLNKPVGIFLLLWPTLWAVWLAAEGRPHLYIILIFVLGVVLMRSAGCIVNDIADRHVDKFVKRTAQRPLTAGKITVKSALVLFFILVLAAFSLVLFLNTFVIELAVIGLLLAMIYPFLKRVTHLPQLGLGLAFAWGVPMAFAAVQKTVPAEAWIVFAAAVLWPFIYDTMYAMADREEDKKIGIKSTAILFGSADIIILTVLQIIFIALLIAVGYIFSLTKYYYFAIILAAVLLIYQIYLIHDRQPDKCLRAFLNNQWVGLIIFLGIVVSYL